MGARMKKRFLITAALFALFAVFTVLVSKVDVQPIGPEGSEVGFAGINGYFRDVIGYHESWNIIGDFIGYLVIASVVAFAMVGLVQLLRDWNVDFRILLLGCFYVSLLAVYILFVKVIINYRPVILDEEGLESSYPSSHTILGVCCMGAAMMQIQYMLKKTPMLRAVAMGVCAAVGIMLPVARMLAGVHWFTDIVGGVILSAALLMLYYSMVKFVGSKIRKRPARRR